MLNDGPDHWFVCNTHMTKWRVGSNLFSAWQHLTDEQLFGQRTSSRDIVRSRVSPDEAEDRKPTDDLDDLPSETAPGRCRQKRGLQTMTEFDSITKITIPRTSTPEERPPSLRVCTACCRRAIMVAPNFMCDILEATTKAGLPTLQIPKRWPCARPIPYWDLSTQISRA